MNKSLLVVTGTRPEIIKMAPIIKNLIQENIPFHFVHTGQHYDYFMSQVFIDSLELPKPEYSFFIKVRNPAIQTARIMTKIGKYIATNTPSITLIQGDTNTILATALASVKQNVPVGHVEAGLRSYDLRMQEEHNRRLVDHISKLLFAPTEYNKQTLMKENVWGDIYVTGNTVIDACNQYIKIAEEKSNILDSIRFSEYVLVTFHRAENVDNKETLKTLVNAFIESEVPIVIPIHPRTKKRLNENGLLKKLKNSKNIQIIPPANYFDNLVLMKNSKFIATDSGGLQEEATAPVIRKFVLILRKSTERIEAIEAGFAKLVELEKEKIIAELRENFSKNHKLPSKSPYGDGDASKKIVKYLTKYI
ncbi:MAG: non-hydrolyzing UDP-N-acetylglucosamine 2-epimerase [Candidatus Asgardarchaeia archaeon]